MNMLGGGLLGAIIVIFGADGGALAKTMLGGGCGPTTMVAACGWKTTGGEGAETTTGTCGGVTTGARMVGGAD